MTRATMVVGLLVSAALCFGCGASTATDVDAGRDADIHEDGGQLDAAGNDAGHDASASDAGMDTNAACDADGDHHLSDSAACGGDDCDDSEASTHPGQIEVCNGIDDNCNGTIDEGVSSTFYVDADGDGFGDPTMTIQACHVMSGYAASGTDCDDTVAAVHPGALETCDMIDNDCNGVVDDAAGGCACTAGGSRPCPAAGRCAAGIEQCIAGAWSACTIGPIPETCNGIDDNCNGSIDEGLAVTCYADADDDTYASAAASLAALCPDAARGAVGGCPVGYTNRPPIDAASSDCNDASALQHPGAHEACNGIDDDCNGLVDDACS